MGIRNSLKILLFLLHCVGIPLSRNDLRIKSFENCHVGQRCFIIGNGPSLRIEDLDRLKKELTFGCNGIYKAYGLTDWRPTYFSAIDRGFLSGDIEAYGDCSVSPFFTGDTLRKLIPDSLNAIYIPFLGWCQHWKGPRFSPNALMGVFGGGTVVYFQIQLAYYMGCKEIYLVGVDFDYQYSKEAQPNETIDVETPENYFIPNYHHPGQKHIVWDPERQLDSYRQARIFAQAHDLKIYNATRGGKLEVFERVALDEVLASS